jgi:DNA repair photolyase
MSKVKCPYYVVIMIVKEIHSKSILSKSKVLDYSINPYVGCEHGCTYCYARFMKRYTNHKEAWGQFVDVKINAASLLQHEAKAKRASRVWISGVCDPYQPLEKKYELTKRCLEILLKHHWHVTVQTKSPLVLRDMELLRKFSCVEVGVTITTADSDIKKIFEPNSPSIRERLEILDKLHSNGIQTFAMIAPILPKVKGLAEQLIGKVDRVLIDKMNYHYADWVYKKHRLEYAMTDSFFTKKKKELTETLKKEGIPHQLLF